MNEVLPKIKFTHFQRIKKNYNICDPLDNFGCTTFWYWTNYMLWNPSCWLSEHGKHALGDDQCNQRSNRFCCQDVEISFQNNTYLKDREGKVTVLSFI